MLFDDLPEEMQTTLKEVYNFEPDEVNLLFKSRKEIEDLIYLSKSATSPANKSSAVPVIDDGEEDGEIKVEIGNAQRAAMDAANSVSRQKNFAPGAKVSTEELKSVQDLLNDLKEVGDDEEDSDEDTKG